MVTDVSFRLIDAAITSLRQWFTGMIKGDPRGTEAKDGERLRTQMKDRARDGLEFLEILSGRYNTLRDITAPRWWDPRRAVGEDCSMLVDWNFSGFSELLQIAD